MDSRKLPLITRLSTILLAACLASAAAAADIYRWTDAAGRTHFGDQRPAQHPATRLTEANESHERPLTINITPHAFDLSPATRARTITSIQRIFDVYRTLFRLNLRHPVLVDIHLFPDADSMAQWAHKIAPDTTLPNGLLGLYFPAHNVIGVWNHNPDELAVAATLLHESSHVLLAQLSPKAPAWLHEGLAQYFEGMDMHADAIVINPVKQASAAIDWFVAEKQLITLQQYFSLDEKQWRHQAYVAQSPIPYSVAWSITYFMMSRPVGRQILIELLQDLDKAQQAPTSETINHRYPGGYSLMEFDWFKWAQSPREPQTLRR